ncbi:hypothetical protein [Nonomuraea sp. LPB2021202275-12-8]|uniref:hypothetical protein n=1 Tax=Nonomuraea sp. LPB2021202275-12-8 TaxID=3120159 RepID=UPI00300D97A7
MLKRTLVMLAAPALIASGLIVAASGSAAAAPPIECKLYANTTSSTAHCRYHREYRHWISCDNNGTNVETTQEFTGRRNTLSCAEGYTLTNYGIGA